MKKKIVFYNLLLLLAIFMSFNLGLRSGHRPIESSEEIIQKLNKEYEGLLNNFDIEGYEQIVYNHTAFVGLPDLLNKYNQDEGLYKRSKMLIYKNQSNGNIVLLHMIASQDIGTQWLASLAYQPDVYNSPEGQFASSYDTIYSDCSMYQYSFNHENIRYYITSISKEVGSDGIQPLNEAAKFAEALFLFIK